MYRWLLLFLLFAAPVSAQGITIIDPDESMAGFKEMRIQVLVIDDSKTITQRDMEQRLASELTDAGIKIGDNSLLPSVWLTLAISETDTPEFFAVGIIEFKRLLTVRGTDDVLVSTTWSSGPLLASFIPPDNTNLQDTIDDLISTFLKTYISANSRRN